MKLILPEVKRINYQNGYTKVFDSFIFKSETSIDNIEEILKMKFWNYTGLKQSGNKPIHLIISSADPKSFPDFGNDGFPYEQAYKLEIKAEKILLSCFGTEGFIYGLSTLKQLFEKRKEEYICPLVSIIDWPSIKYRGLSTTFAWYAGYGRIGFDMQLWGMVEWKEFLNICSDYKINQINLCLYGYWPFELSEYPETVFKNFSMRIWNPESENWLEVEYKHPNIAEQFLPELIKYGHILGIKFFAYIGLNSYNGGYASVHKEKRMKLPSKSQFINDFDSLCLSDNTVLTYLKKSMQTIIEQGFDGIDFEESEEAFWYCNCESCKNTFWKNASTPEETLHAANSTLLNFLYKELKKIKPDIIIGLRAWRQPPLVRSESLIKQMVESIPDDIVLFWAPGQYVEDSEFEKWVKAFGRERIRARDTEAIGFAAGLGRLIRPFKCNGLRCEEESITQYIEEDIRQHRGSVKMKVAGINGYLFEWFGFFMALFVHSYYGWGGDREPEDFYHYALKTVFGNLEPDIYDVMTNMFTIHESQLNIFTLKFPFAANKVEERDIPRINKAIADYPRLISKLNHIMNCLAQNKEIAHFRLHFKKWKISLERSRVIYELALKSLSYEKAISEEEKRRYLWDMYWLNEKEFDIIKANYFDVNPVEKSGVKSCMIPYHELKRILLNKIFPDQGDTEPVYLGVESLGWMWL